MKFVLSTHGTEQPWVGHPGLIRTIRNPGFKFATCGTGFLPSSSLVSTHNQSHAENCIRRGSKQACQGFARAWIQRRSCGSVCAAVRGDYLRWRVFAWGESLRAVRGDDAKWERGSRCGTARGGALWCDGALGRAAGAREFECACGDAAGDFDEPRTRCRLRGDGEHESLDARRDIWLAGGGCRRDWHVLDEYDAECSAVGWR